MTRDHPGSRFSRSARLLVTVTDGRGRRKSAGRLSVWLREVAPKAARGEVAIALVGDRKMRDLNRQFRGIDKVTDVLSFTVDPGPVPPVPVARPFLGDIVIATGRAAQQARAAGKRNISPGSRRTRSHLDAGLGQAGVLVQQGV